MSTTLVRSISVFGIDVTVRSANNSIVWSSAALRWRRHVIDKQTVICNPTILIAAHFAKVCCPHILYTTHSTHLTSCINFRQKHFRATKYIENNQCFPVANKCPKLDAYFINHLGFSEKMQYNCYKGGHSFYCTRSTFHHQGGTFVQR